MENSNQIPKWIKYYTIFFVVLGFNAAAIGYFMPGMMFMNVKVDFAEITTITGMFGARNLTFGVMAIMALYFKDPKYYFVLFVARFVTELQDMVVLTTTNAMPVPAILVVVSWLLFFLAPEYLAIKWLWNQINLTSAKDSSKL
ncbi:MAG: hypothetical protein SFY32_05645 [Bacteroidota bacterium]|nr:hypothetical protein [Bacteroidota bacterium]